MTSKQKTMREMRQFMEGRSMRLRMWMNSRGITPPIMAEKIGVTPPRMRDYLDGHFIPAARLKKMEEAGVPRTILYLDGKHIHDMVIAP